MDIYHDAYIIFINLLKKEREIFPNRSCTQKNEMIYVTY